MLPSHSGIMQYNWTVTVVTMMKMPFSYICGLQEMSIRTTGQVTILLGP